LADKQSGTITNSSCFKRLLLITFACKYIRHNVIKAPAKTALGLSAKVYSSCVMSCILHGSETSPVKKDETTVCHITSCETEKYRTKLKNIVRFMEMR